MLDASLEANLNTFHLSLQLTAATGKTTVLLGESGSGKTTVLRLLAGLLHPQAGHIVLDEVTYFDSRNHILRPAQQRPFGYVFQDYVLFPHLTVFENVAFGLRAQYLSRALIRQRVGVALEQVRMLGFERRRPSQLSGGQQQRVAIARALALQPRLLLLDEPLSALDVQTRREVRHELRLLLAEAGITTVLVTHQYLEALLFGHEVCVLDNGAVIQRGSQQNLLLSPRSSYVAELVGVNFFQGRVLKRESELVYGVQLHNNGLIVMATMRDHTDKDDAHIVGQEAYVVVDPRNVTLHQQQLESSARNLLHGVIVQLLALGTGSGTPDSGVVRISIQLDNSAPPLTAEITAASAARMELREGQPIYASFKAAEASMYL